MASFSRRLIVWRKDFMHIAQSDDGWNNKKGDQYQSEHLKAKSPIATADIINKW